MTEIITNLILTTNPAQRECEYNIRRFKAMWGTAQRMLSGDREKVEGLMRAHDGLGMLEYLEGIEGK